MLSQTKHQQECNNQIEAEPLNRVMKHPDSTLYINSVFYLTYSGTGALMENLCSVNLSDISKMLVKKQMKYFDVPLDHALKVPILQELLNTRMNNLYVEGFDIIIIKIHLKFQFII